MVRQLIGESLYVVTEVTGGHNLGYSSIFLLSWLFTFSHTLIRSSKFILLMTWLVPFSIHQTCLQIPFRLVESGISSHNSFIGTFWS